MPQQTRFPEDLGFTPPRLPDVEFLCVSTGWTKTLHEVQLRAHPNIKVVPGSDDLDAVYRQMLGMQRTPKGGKTIKQQQKHPIAALDRWKDLMLQPLRSTKT